MSNKSDKEKSYANEGKKPLDGADDGHAYATRKSAFPSLIR